MKTYKLYDVPNGRLNDFAKGYTGAGYPDACKLFGGYETIEECREAFKIQIDLAFDPDGALNGAIFDAMTGRGFDDDVANAAAYAAVMAAEKEAQDRATAGDDPASWSYDLGDLHYLRVMVETVEIGTLYICDKNGINAEPLNADDKPYTIEEADACDVGQDATIRRATVDDDCAPEVTHVAVDDDGKIVGFYKFVMVEEA